MKTERTRETLPKGAIRRVACCHKYAGIIHQFKTLRYYRPYIPVGRSYGLNQNRWGWLR